MANIWSHLRGKAEERLSVNDWAAMFNYNGNAYPIGGYGTGINVNDNHEDIEQDFVGYVNGAYKQNGVVFAVCMARQLLFTEAKFTYQRLQNGRPGDLFGTPDLGIFEKPWPNGSTGELLARAIQDTDLAGNHYVVREGSGPNARLRRLRPDWVTILLSSPPDEAVRSDVKGYIYKPGGTSDASKWETYPVDGSNGEIVHWSPIPDPEAQYRGMSWLTPVMREIMADKAADKHRMKFFENAATPNLAVTFADTVTPEQFREFKKMMNDTKHGVDHAYETLYLGGGADVHVIGSSMQQMEFKVSGEHAETRIAAAGRVHPSIIGFTEGRQGALITSENLKAAKNVFADGTMRPLWRSLCAAYAALVPELTGARLWYDDRDIAFLRQDKVDVSSLQQMQSNTIANLIMQGFTPDSVTAAVVANDWSLLEHTGLYSVQLQPPMPEGQPNANEAKPMPKATDTKPPAGPDNPSKGVSK